MDRDGGNLRRLTQQQRHRHRAGVHARRQADLLRQRPRRRPADLPRGRRRRQRRARDASPAATTSARRSAPTGARWPTSLARAAAFKVMMQDLAGGTARSRHRHQRRREPELRAQRPADRLRHARARARRVDDHHARRQDQARACCRPASTCASRSGDRSAAEAPAPTHRKESNHDQPPSHHAVRRAAQRLARRLRLVVKLDDKAARGRCQTPARRAAPRNADANRAGTAQSAVATVDADARSTRWPPAALAAWCTSTSTAIVLQGRVPPADRRPCPGAERRPRPSRW